MWVDEMMNAAKNSVRIYKEFEDQWKEKVLKQHKVSCKDKCSHCCYQITLSNLPSSVLIVDFLSKKGEEGKKLLINAAEQGKRMQDVLLAQKGGVVEGRPKACREWVKKVEPCVFLGKDKSCLIYEVRPPCCSYYFVVSDPELCDVRKVNKRVGIVDMEVMLEVEAQCGKLFSENLNIPYVPFMPLGISTYAAVHLIESRDSFMRVLSDK